MTINIHTQLQNDCIIIGRFSLCHLLLMNDCNYPWFILVPDRVNVSEIHQLSSADQTQLIAESSKLSSMLKSGFNADKINIAALGNIVPQLHIHHIARYKTDAAWPAPVWGKVAAKPYTADNINLTVDLIRPYLNEDFEYLKNDGVR